MRSRRRQLLFTLALMAWLIPGLRAEDGQPSVPPPISSKTVEALTGLAIRSHVGEERTVCGYVVSMAFSKDGPGSPVALHLDKLPPNETLRVVVPEDSKIKITSPESRYLHKWICATGGIARDDKGRFILAIRDAKGLVVNDERDWGKSVEQSASSRTFEALTGLEVASHVGEERIVCGCVTSALPSRDGPGSPVALHLGNPAQDNALRVVVPETIRTQIGSPEVDSLYNWVCAFGRIMRDDKGRLALVVNAPKDLVIHDEQDLLAHPVPPPGDGSAGAKMPDCSQGGPPLTDVEARYHVGKRRTVCGFVAGIKEVPPRKMTALFFGGPFPQQIFTVLVPKDIQSESWNLETEFLSNRVCATGKIFLNKKGFPGLVISDKQNIVHWTEVQRLGERHKVCGSVAEAKELTGAPGKPFALFLDRPSPDQTLAVLIPQDARHKFDDPGKFFLRKRICATGKLIKNEKEALGLVVNEKADLVSWTDALREGEGEGHTACGVVAATKDLNDRPKKATALFLGNPPPDQAMTIFISEDLRRELGNPADYLNKAICATGKLIKNEKGVPALAIRDAKDIQAAPPQ